MLESLEFRAEGFSKLGIFWPTGRGWVELCGYPSFGFRSIPASAGMSKEPSLLSLSLE